MGQWAIRTWNRDLAIRGVKCWVSIAIFHTSMFYTCDCVCIGRERYMIVNSNGKLAEKKTFPFKNLIHMGQWAIKMWNRDLVIRGVRCWISNSILHTSMFYTRDRVSISRERYMIINSNGKLVEVWEQMQHAKKCFRKSFSLFQLASHQFQPVFLKGRHWQHGIL